MLDLKGGLEKSSFWKGRVFVALDVDTWHASRAAPYEKYRDCGKLL